jgi:hypothetical protein
MGMKDCIEAKEIDGKVIFSWESYTEDTHAKM